MLVSSSDLRDPSSPTGQVGIDAALIVPGWTVCDSFFAMPENSYSTNFGIDAYLGQHSNPELYFTVEIQRQIWSPFITHLIPLAVILLTLFILLCLSERNADERFGFDSVAVIATVVGIFFVVIFQHIALRRSLEAEGFVYLERFYFLAYLYLLLVTVNAVVTVVDVRPPGTTAGRGCLGGVLVLPIAFGRSVLLRLARLLNHDENRTVRYAYWPTFAGLVWLLTLWMALAGGG